MVINEDGVITENQNEQKDSNVTNAEDTCVLNNETSENEENFDLDSNNVISSDNNIDTENEDNHSNCLALTVRKDYNLSIVKNSIFTTLRVSWKIAISTFILNILKLFW